jgi:hypothetical protein
MTTAAHFRHWFLCSISDNEKGLDDRLCCVKIGRTGKSGVGWMSFAQSKDQWLLAFYDNAFYAMKWKGAAVDAPVCSRRVQQLAEKTP